MVAVFKVDRDQLAANLTLVVTTAPFPTALVHLFVTSVTPDADMAPGDFVEASWTGYANQTAGTWSTVAFDGDIAYSETPLLSFPVTSGGTGTNVYGYFVTDSGGSNVLFAELLDTPVPVNDGVPVQLVIRYRTRNA